MATMFESGKGLIYRTSTALVEHEIPKKISDTITGLVTSSFEIVNEGLKIVQGLTAPQAAQPQPPSPP
jgi:hypothetical protein